MRPKQCTYCKNYPCDLARKIEEGIKFAIYNHTEKRWVKVDSKDVKCARIVVND